MSLTVVTPGPHIVSSTRAIQVLGLGSEPDALVVAGAGFTDAWDTEIVLGNPFDSDLAVVVFTKRISSEYGGCPFAGECPPPEPRFLTLSPNSQIIVHYSDLFPPGLTGLYISSAPDDPLSRLPAVRARSFATVEPRRAMELPIVSYEALVSRPASSLVFVGARKSATSHSNLFLGETAAFVDSMADVRIDAIDTSGIVVGSAEQSIPAGGSILVSDVIGAMGIADFEGQVRVTQIGGSGVVTGALATLADDGSFAVSAGFIP